MQTDSNNKLWIGCEYGLISLSKSNTILFNKKNSSLPFNETSAIYIEKDNSKYIGTYRGFVIQVSPYMSVIDSTTINNNYPISKIIVGDNNLIVTSNNTLWSNDKEIIFDSYINNLEYFDNSYWFSTINHLYKFHFNFFKKIKIKKIRSFKNLSYIYSNNKHIYIYADKDGTRGIWQSSGKFFKPILFDKKNYDITSFIINKNKLWIATHNKLSVFEKQNERFVLLADTFMQVNCMEVADTGIWVGTRQNGLIKIRYKNYSTVPDISVIADSVVCDNYENSGGSEVSIKKMNLGKESGIFILEYEMYKIPDKITIYSAKDKSMLFSSQEAVSGNGKIKIEYSNTKYIIIRVDGNINNTNWKYKIKCLH